MKPDVAGTRLKTNGNPEGIKINFDIGDVGDMLVFKLQFQ